MEKLRKKTGMFLTLVPLLSFASGCNITSFTILRPAQGGFSSQKVCLLNSLRRSGSAQNRAAGLQEA